MISQKLLEQMIQKYGESKQLDMVSEECSELSIACLELAIVCLKLTKAVSKYKREDNEENIPLRIKSIAEEEADVRIMLEQIDIMMLKYDPDYTKRVGCEMNIKEKRIKKMLGVE